MRNPQPGQHEDQMTKHETGSLYAWYSQKALWPYEAILVPSFLIVYVIQPSLFWSEPGLNQLLAWLPQQIPAMQHNIAASKMRDIAAVYYPLFALISPVAAVGAWQMLRRRTTWITSFWKTPLRNLLRLPFLLLFCGGMYWITFQQGGTQLNSMPHNESRFFLFLVGHFAGGTSFWIFVGVTARAIYSLVSKEGF